MSHQTIRRWSINNQSQGNTCLVRNGRIRSLHSPRIGWLRISLSDRIVISKERPIISHVFPTIPLLQHLIQRTSHSLHRLHFHPKPPTPSLSLSLLPSLVRFFASEVLSVFYLLFFIWRIYRFFPTFFFLFWNFENSIGQNLSFIAEFLLFFGEMYRTSQL